MAAVRRNILADSDARDAYIQGVLALKREQTAITTRQLGVSGTTRQLSTWDLFVYWHHRAMTELTPDGQRNLAHQGPVFAPWHRFMLIFLEAQLQRVLGDRNFGLPYWDWAADGERPRAQQRNSPLWSDDCMGPSGDASAGDVVPSGPFSATSDFRVRIVGTSGGALLSTDRPLRRRFGATASLPRRSEVSSTLNQTSYDSDPWLADSDGLRARLEGWLPPDDSSRMHNRVHVWVGGDMLPSSSPNDPVFYLNHCNVDRIWQAWLAGDPPPTPAYLPGANADPGLLGHRLDDRLFSVFTAADDDRWTPRAMLDVSSIYTYDSLAVA